MRRADVALSPNELAEVRAILAAHLPPGARVAVFGSRASGRARPFSDLDLLIEEPAQLDWRTRVALVEAFEASDLPFRVDVVEAGWLAPAFAEQLRREAVTIFAPGADEPHTGGLAVNSPPTQAA